MFLYLLSFEGARTILLPTLSYHLKSLMQQGELEAAKCLDIHGDILRVLKRNDVVCLLDVSVMHSF